MDKPTTPAGAQSEANGIFTVSADHGAVRKHEEESLRAIDAQAHRLWELGRNAIVGWRPHRGGIALVVARDYVLLEHADSHPRMVHGRRRMGARTFAEVAARLGVEAQTVAFPWSGGELPWPAVESIVARYAISQTRHRAVILFDIVGFSLLTPREQMAQINSLENSINIARARMQQRGVRLDLARSSTGDGCYVWNRHKGLQSDLDLCSLLMLVLADNAIAQAKGRRNLVPRLRASFTIGSHWSYRQVEGANGLGADYIVGDATIALARLLEKALPGQILIGDFARPGGGDGTGAIDTVAFIARSQHLLDRFLGIELWGERVSDIRCYLTGPPTGEGRFEIARHRISDKHGLHHCAFNAKMNLHRGGGDPIFLGVQASELAAFDASIAGVRSAA
jgi:hypothetical protein